MHPRQRRPGRPRPVYCQACGSEIRIFIRHSLGWRNYRTTAQTGIEPFDPGHAPIVGWRTAPPATG